MDLESIILEAIGSFLGNTDWKKVEGKKIIFPQNVHKGRLKFEPFEHQNFDITVRS